MRFILIVFTICVVVFASYFIRLIYPYLAWLTHRSIQIFLNLTPTLYCLLIAYLQDWDHKCYLDKISILHFCAFYILWLCNSIANSWFSEVLVSVWVLVPPAFMPKCIATIDASLRLCPYTFDCLQFCMPCQVILC